MDGRRQLGCDNLHILSNKFQILFNVLHSRLGLSVLI